MSLSRREWLRTVGAAGALAPLQMLATPAPSAGKRLSPPVRLICREDKADRLLADLAARRTDVVLSDSPISINDRPHFSITGKSCSCPFQDVVVAGGCLAID